MGTVAIICIAAVVVAIVIVLAILVYNQMLLLNEVNKRLLVMAQDASEKYHSSLSELNDATNELDRVTEELDHANELLAAKEEKGRPSSFVDEDLEL